MGLFSSTPSKVRWVNDHLDYTIKMTGSSDYLRIANAVFSAQRSSAQREAHDSRPGTSMIPPPLETSMPSSGTDFQASEYLEYVDLLLKRPPRSNHGSVYHPHRNGLRVMLRTISTVQRLSISTVAAEPGNGIAPLRVRADLKLQRWPRLTHFSLSNISTHNPDEFSVWVTVQMPHLEHLTLARMTLRDGLWDRVLDLLQLARPSCLYSFHKDSLYHRVKRKSDGDGLPGRAHWCAWTATPISGMIGDASNYH